MQLGILVYLEWFRVKVEELQERYTLNLEQKQSHIESLVDVTAKGHSSVPPLLFDLRIS
uniref:Uncharacterized protein n=1 Tax=Anguilla anguilla TaxID=7936 RepID=A0A0E9RY31_ANGAN